MTMTRKKQRPWIKYRFRRFILFSVPGIYFKAKLIYFTCRIIFLSRFFEFQIGIIVTIFNGLPVWTKLILSCVLGWSGNWCQLAFACARSLGFSCKITKDKTKKLTKLEEIERGRKKCLLQNAEKHQEGPHQRWWQTYCSCRKETSSCSATSPVNVAKGY